MELHVFLLFLCFYPRQKAAEEEYDLSNPAVISFLVKMQEGHMAKLETQQTSGSEGKEDDGDSGSGPTERESTQPEEGIDQVLL